MKLPRLVRTRHHDRLVLDALPPPDHRNDLLEEAAIGLARKPKLIAPKFFYDERGSQLFEQITETEEYYPTRTEAALLQAHGAAIIDAASGSGAGGLTLIELGSGSSTKTRLLLDVLHARQQRVDYVPIDISPSVVAEFGAQLLDDYPALYIRGLICDYHQAMDALHVQADQPRLFIFLGSSLGNYTPEAADTLLASVHEAMGPRDHFLLGLDQIKDAQVLHAAYNDAAGVTAAFNLNLLERINRELGGQFDLDLFRHKAFYNAAEQRIEMHLESSENQLVRVDALHRSFAFHKGETIHTENSYKFDPAKLPDRFARVGLRQVQKWEDAQGWFGLNLLAPA